MQRELKIEQARSLRRSATPPERMLWNLLRGRKLAGLRFRRQQPVGPYIADFYCAEAKLVIELDSSLHDREHDQHRDEFMRSEGIAVLRLPCAELPDNAAGLLRTIKRDAVIRIEELKALDRQPSPLGGEGRIGASRSW